MGLDTSSILAPLQRANFAFPALAPVAARAVYRHRLVLATPREDRSLMYGSSLQAAEMVLTGATVEGVLEDVLGSVEVPV